MQSVRIGTLLAQRGLLSDRQVQQVLNRQNRDSRPFGLIAEELFDVSEHAIWNACAEQLRRECPFVNLQTEAYDPGVLNMLTARQAWENLVLPLRMDGDTLICATTEETLGSAIGLMERQTEIPCRFVITDIRPLEQFIAERYHYEGVDVG